MTERWRVKGPHKHNLSHCLKDKECVTRAAVILENQKVRKCAYFSGKNKVKMEDLLFGKVQTDTLAFTQILYYDIIIKLVFRE